MKKIAKTRFAILHIGSDQEGYSLPSSGGTEGQVIVSDKNGETRWGNPGEAGPRKHLGRAEFINGDQQIHGGIKFPSSFGHTNYTITIALRHETWAENPRDTQFYQFVITDKTEQGFNIKADRPVIVKVAEKYIIEWTAEEDLEFANRGEADG